MKIKEVKFYKSVAIETEKVFFEEKKEIVFIWRSNVWKSSLMNSLFWEKDMVKTSWTPWKTRTANLFLVNKKMYFTDLPGYWYAKMSKEGREKLEALISWYLEEKKDLIEKAVLLIDSRHWATDNDIAMYKFLMELAIPMIVVLNKVDKIKQNELQKIKNKTKEIFFWQKIIPYSSKTWKYKKEFLDLLDD